MAYYRPDTKDSSLYEKSCLLNHDLVNSKRVNESYMNYKNSVHAFATNHCQQIRDTDKEDLIFKDQYDLKYRCKDASLPKVPDFVDNSLGYECNKGFMYTLDNYNTYHNYLVCENTEKGKVCCPKNVQLFRNHTRRNTEIPMHESSKLYFNDVDKLPNLTYNVCHLYK
jgi:hypothetical protein